MLYYKYSDYLKNKYGEKVYKLPVNLPVTCPNRLDGDGCAFCAGAGTGFEAMAATVSVTEQLTRTRQMITRKYHANKYIAYFQANTNTYGPIEKIQNCVNPFLNKKDVVAISIATRPDCLENDVLEYLAKINTQCDLWVELGLQTIHDKTGQLINRGHTYQEFLDGLNKLRQHKINVCVHIINGLPFETKEMMLQTARELGKLDIQAIKIHMLYVIKNNKLHQI